MKHVNIQYSQNLRLLYVVPRLKSLRNPAGAKDYSLLQKSIRDLGPTQPPIQGVWWAFSPRGTVKEALRNYSPPSTAMIYDQWSYNTSPICLHSADRENFTHLLCFKGLNYQLPQDKKKYIARA